MDEDGVPHAFCLILWRWWGGKLNDRKVPIITDVPTPGHCDRAYDCMDCGYMQMELSSFYKSDQVTWVCTSCADLLKNGRKGVGSHLLLAGFYSSGDCQSPYCVREEKYSAMLQLIIGKITEEGT